ncbi:MAG TPA: hypothetical protein VJI12_02675 [archaeon]|nr:hypothetical protein [archaeon]
MKLPTGFEELVALTGKERPDKPKTRDDIWDKFLYIVFMGGKRGEPDINFMMKMLKSQTALDYVLKTDGEDWRDEVKRVVEERAARAQDEDTKTMLQEFLKELFRTSATVKGGARFFARNTVDPKFLENTLNTRERTLAFIEDLVNDQDVSGVRYTKIILWLQSVGFAPDFIAPSWQTKNFVNEVFGYYQFYDDEKYFMKKAVEIADAVAKKIKKATPRDVAAAIYYYTSIRNMLPLRSPEKKKFTPALLMKYMKAKKLQLKKLNEKFSTYDGREEFMEDFYKFIRKK